MTPAFIRADMALVHSVLFDSFDSHDMTQFFIAGAMIVIANAIRREQSQ